MCRCRIAALIISNMCVAFSSNVYILSCSLWLSCSPMLYPYVTQTSSRSICLFIYLNICVHKHFQYVGELSFSVFYSYFFYKHILFLSLMHFTGIFPFCSLMRSRHFEFGRLRWIYAIYNFSHYPLSSRASHRHRRHTGFRHVHISLSDALYLIETSIIIQMY